MLIGLAGIGAVTAVFALLPRGLPGEIPALLTLVPIALVSVLSGWRAGVPLAIVGGLVHALVFVHPVGKVTFGYSEDVVVLVTYVSVAIALSLLVSRRSIANQAQLIGTERMVLLRSVSHDLRNPLHAILAASTELLDGGDHDDGTRRRLLELVVDEAGRVDRIVANLLSLSRLQAGALVPSRQPVALIDLIDRCARRFERLGETVTIDRSAVDEELTVDVDPVQIDQLITNLVENAIRHSPERVRVTVDARATPGAEVVTVVVRDDGPGFGASVVDHGPVAFRSTGGSSGLGLTVCEAIVDAHGGTLTIDDHHAGGARVSFTLPLAR